MTHSPETLLGGAWRFAAVLVVAVMLLGVLNALPQFLGGEPLGVVRYATVEQAEARLGLRLFRPAAVPSGWRWPPVHVRFEAGEADWVEYVLQAAARDQADGDELEGGALVLCQTLGPFSADGSVPSALMPSGQLLRADAIQMNGRTLRLKRLLQEDGTIVHELWWRDGPRRVMLRGRVPADRLPAIARTILGTP